MNRLAKEMQRKVYESTIVTEKIYATHFCSTLKNVISCAFRIGMFCFYVNFIRKRLLMFVGWFSGFIGKIRGIFFGGACDKLMKCV